MIQSRLFQYQAKTEPVFVPPDTSAVEFAATSPSFSTPVWIKAALVVGTVVTGFGTPRTGDADELRDFTQLADVIHPIERAVSAPFLFFDAEPITVVAVPDFGWHQAFSEPVRPERSPYVQEPAPLTTPFLPGDAAELREFIQLPDVVRPVPRVAQDQHLAIDPDVRIPIDLREGWYQALSEPARPLARATYVQDDALPLNTPFLPGDAAELLTFIQLGDIIRPVSRAVSAPFLFFDPFPIPTPPAVQLEWYQQFSDPVRPVARAVYVQDYGESLEPIVVVVPDFGWYQPPADLIRAVRPLTRGTVTTGFATPVTGTAAELLSFIQLPDVVHPSLAVIHTAITGFGAPPIVPDFGWYRALSEPVRIPPSPHVQEPTPLTTPFLPGDAVELLAFIQLPDVVHPLSREAALIATGLVYVGEPIIVVPAPTVGVYIPTYRRRRR